MHLRRNLIAVIFLCLFLSCCFSQDALPAYRNPSLPAELRAADLVQQRSAGSY